MEFGLALNCHVPVSTAMDIVSPCFDEVVEQIRLAEKLGFSSVWPLAHDEVRGDVPVQWPTELMSRIAAATQAIRIGHRLWPTDGFTNSCLRAAEQAAALDLLCEGRLEIDCTPRAVPAAEAADPEFESEYSGGSRERVLRSVLEAWTTGVPARNGAFYALPDYATIAKPVQRPHPPLWMCVNDSREWEQAGRLGVGVVTSAPPGTALQSRIDTYRHAPGWPARRTVADDRIAVSTLVICSASGASDFDAHQVAPLRRRRRRVFDGFAAAAPPSRLLRRTAIDQSEPGGDQNGGGDVLAVKGLLIGDAARCIEAAQAYAAVGVKRLLCQFPVRDGIHATTTDYMTRFGDDVIPTFA